MRSDQEYFSEWLDRTLVQRGISGGEVAKALGVNDSAVSRWRRGKASPGLDSVMRLAEFLEVQPVRLAVTAGLMKQEAVGVPPFSMPTEDTSSMRRAKDHIMKTPGLSKGDREALLNALKERYAAT